MHLQHTGVTDDVQENVRVQEVGLAKFLAETKVTAEGLEAIVALPITHLAMEGCVLSENEFKVFGKMTSLEELWLSETKMKAEWLKHVSGLPKLRDLDLRKADFDDAAAKHVSKMSSLKSLSVNYTDLGDTGFQELLKLPKLESL